MTSTTMPKFCSASGTRVIGSPSLPTLYFEASSAPLTCSEASLATLPSELLHACLASYADWGDLAKLSSVQKSWSNTVADAVAHGGSESRWDLANLLLGEEDAAKERGLIRNPVVGVKHLQILAKVDYTALEEEEETEEQDSHASDDDDAADFTETWNSDTTNDDETSRYLAPAMRALADCHLTGTGTPASSSLGLSILRHAHSTLHSVDAAHDLALIHEYSLHNVPVDVVKAFKWFSSAAKGGHVAAMAELALCYELGCGVDPSDEDALEWYVRAAERGCASSQFSVGEIYEEARGVPQSDEEACLWYHRALLEGGCEDAKKALRRLEDIARIVLPGVAGILRD